MDSLKLREQEKTAIRETSRKWRKSPSPSVTIFVRHSAGCKYAGDEFAKRCSCRKHFRWSHGGKQFRQKAGTRSWAEAEERRRRLEDQLAGRPSLAEAEEARSLDQAIDVFIQDKKNQGITSKVIDKYSRELARFQEFCAARQVYVVGGVTVELLTGYVATWKDAYPSSTTRAKVRERLRSFLRYAYQAGWIARVPMVSKVQIHEPPTMPLTAVEYARLRDTVYATFADKPKMVARVHAFIQLMRWSGLGIRDALTLKRKEVVYDEVKGVYLIVTSRQKTGTDVSVPISPDVAKEILEVPNGNHVYVFWSGNGEEESATKNWAKHLARLFDDAKIEGGHMRSHRLRDTFAVDLLQNGVPLEEVSKLLGHESIKTTEKSYAKWVKGRQDRLVSLVMNTW